MPLLTLIIALVLVGLLLWAINVYIPLQPTIKKILNIVVVLVVIIFLLHAFGLIQSLNEIRVKPLR